MTGRFSPKTETERLKGFWKPFGRFLRDKKRFARRFIRPLVKTRKKQYNIKLGSVSADAHESKEARVA